MKLGRYKKILDLNEVAKVGVLSGVTDMDVSEAVYTAYVDLLTITPTNDILDLAIELDYIKATTGLSVVATNNDTADIAVFSAIDGTNYRRVKASATKTLTGNANLVDNADRFELPCVDKDTVIKVRIKVSAERADVEIPYKVTYKSLTAPTITAVASA